MSNPPTVWGKLPRSNPQISQEVPGKRMEGETKAYRQSVFIQGGEPRLMGTGIGANRRDGHGKCPREVILLPNPGQVNDRQDTPDFPTGESSDGTTRHRRLAP